MEKRDFISLDDDIMPAVKRRTQLFVRGHQDVPDDIIVTDRDRETLLGFFREFVSELKNKTARHTIDDYEDQLAVTYTEKEVEAGLDGLHMTLVQITQEYHLMRWYDSLGKVRQSGYHYRVYNKLLDDWTGNSTQPAIVQPKYRPYF